MAVRSLTLLKLETAWWWESMDLNDLRIVQSARDENADADGSVFAEWIGRQAKTARVALIGTYTPRRCGIATFTNDIREQLAAHRPDIAVDVFAMDGLSGGLSYEPEVHVIAADHRQAYRDAAVRINTDGADVAWLQHEFGIFGGTDGELVLELVDRIAIPLVVTLHTVLERPSSQQKAIIERLAARASRIMVMAQHSVQLLDDVYGVPRDRVVVIEHGAPDRPPVVGDEAKARLGLAGRNVLMTFGLLGPGKGLERVIEALPAIVARFPETTYRIVGATHPDLVAREGEAYRERLISLAERLGVSAHVEWDNRFLETDQLLDALEGCDIYLTPYPGLQQSTSGTLSYAVALGRAVISTPYIHARELLADEVGVLVDPGDASAIARAVIALMDDPARLEATQQRAWARGRLTIWPRFAAAAATLVEGVIPPANDRGGDLVLPSPAAVYAMSDSTGMLQHAIGPVPDRRHGYCLDDNARALMLMHRLPGAEAVQWAQTYAAFVQHAWNADRAVFRNFMNFDRSWCEDAGSEDSNGRAVWALGDCAARANDPALRRWALWLFDQTLEPISTFESPRTRAFLALGAAEVLTANPGHVRARQVMTDAAEGLRWLLDASRRPAWIWFEAVLGYDNPRLSEALLRAGTALKRDDLIADGLSSLRWIAEQQRASSGHFRPIGSDSLGSGEVPALPFDQQPLEALAAIDAASAAYAASGDPRWLDHAEAAWAWFGGANDRGAVLGDPATGRCMDGLTPHGVNENTGAESILAYQMSYHAMLALSARTRKLPGVARFGSESTDHIEPLAYT